MLMALVYRDVHRGISDPNAKYVRYINNAYTLCSTEMHLVLHTFINVKYKPFSFLGKIITIKTPHKRARFVRYHEKAL